MTPDAFWPYLPAHGQFTAEDHAAHTTRKGIHHPSDVVPGLSSTKLGKLAMKFVHKPHLKMKGPKAPRVRASRRKKKV